MLVQDGASFLAFQRPLALLEAREPEAVAEALVEADAAVRSGRFVAGYLAYEAARAFGLATRDPDPDGPPLLWLGVFDEPAPVALLQPVVSAHPVEWRCGRERGCGS